VQIARTEEVCTVPIELSAGDRIVLVRSGWLGLRDAHSLPVAMAEPGRALVLRQSPREHPWDAVWCVRDRISESWSLRVDLVLVPSAQPSGSCPSSAT